MLSCSQLENLGVATGFGGNPSPAMGSINLPSSQAGAAESSQQGTYLLQTSSSPIVCHTIGSQEEEDSGQNPSSMLYIGPELPWLPRWLVEKVWVGDYVHFN